MGCDGKAEQQHGNTQKSQLPSHKRFSSDGRTLLERANTPYSQFSANRCPAGVNTKVRGINNPGINQYQNDLAAGSEPKTPTPGGTAGTILAVGSDLRPPLDWRPVRPRKAGGAECAAPLSTP